MGIKSEISWCEGTWNPLIGCTRVSAGCDNCYAIDEATKKDCNSKLKAYYRAGLVANGDWTGKVKRNSEKVWNLPLRTSQPTLWFVNSMSDLFHESVSDEDIIEIFDIMNRSTQHTFQVLTKRPNRMLRMSQEGKLAWTPNIWAGVSVELAKFANRVDLLRKVPAAVRFVSAEPLLGPLTGVSFEKIHLIIVGGEKTKKLSKARAMKAEWVREIRDECLTQSLDNLHNVPGDNFACVFHFKQWGSVGPDGVARRGDNGHIFEGAEWRGLPGREIKAVHGCESVQIFRMKLEAENDGTQIKVGENPARIALRKIILETLAGVDSMRNDTLCRFNLAKAGLDAKLARNVNIHAWALSDLNLGHKIEKLKVEVAGKNGRTKKEVHYAISN